MATRRVFISTRLAAGASMAVSGNALASTMSAESGEASAGTVLPAKPPAAAYTRGPGLYPGAPSKNFQPELLWDPAVPYRNLALLRPATASSAYDYNLTAQLVTDGLVNTHLPDWISVIVDGQALPKTEREIVVDGFESSVLELPGSNPTVELYLGGGAVLPAVDRVELFIVIPRSVSPSAITVRVSVSDDGHTWREAESATGGRPLPTENYPPDLVNGSQLLNPSITFDRAFEGRYYRAELGMSALPAVATSSTANAGTPEAAMAGNSRSMSWRLGQMAFFRGENRINLGGPFSFTSAWKGATLDEEWISVDLGAAFTFDNVKLHWIARAAEGKLQVSDDNQHWRDLQSLAVQAVEPTLLDNLRLASPAKGRYVRVLMTVPALADGYILSELEVFGHGGFIVRPLTMPSPAMDGSLNLAGGLWKLQRAGYKGMKESGEVLSRTGFRDDSWVVATVPGTVLTSYLNVGAIPDPNYGQNQLHISDSFFYEDFWYRNEFTAPAAHASERLLLNFGGINWKADIYLNGMLLGRIDGAFRRGSFDVTGKLLPGQSNALAILIHKNDTPGRCKQKTLDSSGKNGGALGADSPTYHASVGRDWIPTIRGRNTGIWTEIHLSPGGRVTLEDPLVTTVLPLPDTSSADITIECVAVNHGDRPFRGNLRLKFGTLEVLQQVSLPGASRQTLRLSASSHKQLRLANPTLWWPAGYGEPHLYDVELSLEGAGEQSGRKTFKAGIRQITSDETGGELHLLINGRRLIAKGGSWGFGTSMLRFRARECDVAVRHHREMNFNMIRNWIGSIGDDAFFEACDRFGVLVWQDFWLANPWDGPVPQSNEMFLDNSRDFISRVRHHACIALYCGRDEWFPPKELDAGLRSQLAELHPDISYVGSSADGVVSGHGPYQALTALEYFKRADPKIHSEIGAPAIPPIESVHLMMPQQALWPLSLGYGLHDFTLHGAQGGEVFNTLLDVGYGGANSAEEWVSLGEIISYEAYRAMFEAQSAYRMGALLWMSHPCWPSFVWQTYDFYFQPTASCFGSKLGAEPLHIQWNSLKEVVEVVNNSAGTLKGLTARVEILNMDGSTASDRSAQVDSIEDSTEMPFSLEYSAALSPVHFLRLTLTEGGKVHSNNFYLRGTEKGDYKAIRTLGKARVTAKTTMERCEDRWFLSTELQNTSAFPALFARVQAERETTGDRILPAIYDNNYIALMPKERRILSTEVAEEDTRGESPRISVRGFNVSQEFVP